MWGQSLRGSGNVWVLIVIIWLNKTSPPARQFQLPQYMTREQLYKLWGACFVVHRNQSHIKSVSYKWQPLFQCLLMTSHTEDTAQESSRSSLRNKPMWSVTENGKKIATKDKRTAKEGKVRQAWKKDSNPTSVVLEKRSLTTNVDFIHHWIYYGYALRRTQWRQIQEHRRAKWVGQEG